MQEQFAKKDSPNLEAHGLTPAWTFFGFGIGLPIGTVDRAMPIVDPTAEALALARGCSKRTRHRPPSPAPSVGRGEAMLC
jgi:hypothetical protein